MSSEIVDIERLVGDYLRSRGIRAVGQAPDKTATAWVRITLLDARDLSEPIDHLTSFLVQFDAYAGKDVHGETHGQPEAVQLGRTLRAALRDLPGTHTGAVVSGTRIVGHARVPDTDFEPARERIVLTAEIYAHAAPVAA